MLFDRLVIHDKGAPCLRSRRQSTFLQDTIRTPVNSLEKTRQYSLPDWLVLRGFLPYIPYIVLLLSLSMSLLLWRLYDNSLKTQAELIFQSRAEELRDRIFKALQMNEQILRGAQGLFDASGAVTRDEWRRYVATLKLGENYPGIQGVGFTQWLTPGELPAHLEKIRSEGFPEYAINPEGKRDSYTSIVYLEPFDWRNQRAFGFDMFSEPIRRAAMEKARDSGAAAIAATIILIQETDKDRQNGMLMYMPVYRHDVPVDTIQARRTALSGFVYSPMRATDFIRASLGEMPTDIGFELFSSTAGEGESLLFSSAMISGGTLEPEYRPDYQREMRFDAFNRSWRISFVTLPGFSGKNYRVTSYAALGGGILISILLTMISLLLFSAQAKAAAAARLHQENEERYRAYFNLPRVGTAMTSPEKGWIEVNQHLCEILGYSENELTRLTWSELTYPADLEADLTLFQKVLNGKIDSYSLDKRFIRKDGEIVWTSLSVHCVRKAAGDVDYLIAHLEDITKRKRAEEEVETLNAALAARAVDLERVNRELEAFSYSVSHDLRKPLTVINGYVQILQDLCGRDLNDDCRGHLQEIANGALRMNDLIDILLNFSQVNSKDLNRETVDLSAIARIVASDLALSGPERFVDFKIGHDITASGDAKLLQIVLENLLGNAWKYTAIRKEAVIEFGVTKVAGETACFIRDNGTGFDMAHADKIFIPFQRLPGADKYKGHGIGLGTVERIIKRHGGRVWAEGTPGQGATFYFTLPG